MRIVPVLDVMAGQVVRGIAGERHRYRPWQSPLAASSDPLQVARAFRVRFGLAEIYVADLDAILGASPNLPLLRALIDDGFRLWLDAGIRTAVDVEPLRQAGVARIVAGLETLAGPEVLAAILAEDVVFSLDLKAGEPLGRNEWAFSPLSPRLWGGRGNGGEGGTANPRQPQDFARDTDPPHPGPLPPQSQGERGKTAIDIVRLSVGVGISKILVLDLARVGVGLGLGTDELIANLRSEFPRLEVTAGGGVRDRGDLDRLSRLGVRSVLVASALHDGRLTPADVAELGS